jgi:hypothetical protein
MKRLVMLALGVVLVLGVQDYARTGRYQCWDQGGPSTPVEPFAPGYEVVSYERYSGELKLKFSITYFPNSQLKPDCDTLLMTVYPFNGLTFTGPDSFWVPYRDINPYSTVWLVTLPLNDTSYLVFREKCGNTAYHYGLTFVTTADTLVIRWGSGDRDRELVYEWTMRSWEPYLQKDYERTKREWEKQQEQLKRFKGKGTTGPVMKPEDSALVDSLSDRGKRLLGRMRQLERRPLTDQERQWFVIDGRWYLRERGEREFHLVKGKTMDEIRAEAQRRWDSLLADPSGPRYDVILDLREKAAYEAARLLTDSLIETGEAGFYRVVVDKATLTELIQRGIKYRRTNPPKWRDLRRPHRGSGSEPEKKDESSLPVRDEGQEVLFFEGFEGAWPGSWATSRMTLKKCGIGLYYF